MKRSFYILLAVLVPLGLFHMSGCSDKDKSPVLAKVGKEKITLDDFRTKLADYPGMTRKQAMGNQDVRRRILNDLIERALLLREAEKRSIEVSKTEIDQEVEKILAQYPGRSFEKMLAENRINFETWKARIADSLLLKRVVKQITEEKVQITDAMIKEYYDQNQKDFVVPEQVRALHIISKSQEDAIRLRKRLKKGESFAELAKQHSQGPESKDGGDLGFFSRGVMPPIFDEVVFGLRKNGISDVVTSEYGYHIFKLVDRKESVQNPLEEVSAKIRQQLFERQKEEIYAKWLETTLKQTKVYRNEALFAQAQS